MSDVNEMDDLFDEEFGDAFSEVKAEPVKQPQAEIPVAPTPAPRQATQPQRQASAPAPAPQPQRQASAPAPQAKKASADEDEGGSFVAFGQTVTAIPIERFKASTSSKARIAILSKQVLAVKTHYVEGLGTILCLDDRCCELEGLPKVRYLIPIVQYECNKAGGVISNSLELKVLSVGAEQYEAIATAVQLSGRDIQDVDIIVTCSDEQYQKLTFAADASAGAQWKTFQGAKDIVEKYKANKSKMYLAVARKVSLETYLMRKGFVNKAPTSVGENANLDDLLDE